MQDSTREAAGFLCRWALFGLAGLMLFLGTWLGTLAAGRTQEEIGSGLVMADRLAAPGEQLRLVGWVPSAALAGTSPLLFLCRPRGPVEQTYVSHGGVYSPLLTVGNRTERMRLKGNPYGALCFGVHDAVLAPARPDADLFLLDARLLEGAAAGGAEALRSCVQALARLGSVAFMHAEPVERFLQRQRLARRAYPDLTLLFSTPGRPSPTQTLHDVSWTWARNARRAILVTSDGDLARQAAAEGFPTHWVSPTPVPVVPAGRVVRHSSLAMLKEFLLSKPIRP